MSVLGIDLGGTKLAAALFSESGKIQSLEITSLNNRTGTDVGKLIVEVVKKFMKHDAALQSIGVSVPGISHSRSGTVWAPNIPGWENYPLLLEVKNAAGTIPVSIDSDRACSILGETWQGKAKGCNDAIFLAVGTGIGAGILINGEVLRGASDIAGAVGWMALKNPFVEKYVACGCFEYYASGVGIPKLTHEILGEKPLYNGTLKRLTPEEIKADHVFKAYDENDEVAVRVIRQCIEFWGMGVANLISIFNPEKIIFGGGVFGPAVKFIPAIEDEAKKWAQPISMKEVSFESSGLGVDAAVYGAAFLALKNINQD